VTVLTASAVREVQIPLIAMLMLGASCAKVLRAVRVGSVTEGLGPTALFPMRLRKPLDMMFCAVEFGLGVGLIATAGRIGAGAPANCIRLGAGLMFLVATSALIELRSVRPDVGCGCFGDFSTAPVSVRTLVRSVLLSAAALSTIGLHYEATRRTGTDAATLLVIMIVELIVLAALSPELGEGLIRLGYSEPCELRALPAERSLAALRRSKQWRRYAGLVTADAPADVWRELCWRYMVFPARYGDRATELVFAIFLQNRRPAIHVAMVDALTGAPVPWPAQPPTRRKAPRQAVRRLAPGVAGALLTAPPASAGPDMPFSSDL
jgi:hypothetical protein